MPISKGAYSGTLVRITTNTVSSSNSRWKWICGHKIGWATEINYQNMSWLLRVFNEFCHISWTGKNGVPACNVGNQPISCYINFPMFGFQSLLSTIWYRIHKGIILTSTMCILVSLFDIPSLFDTSSIIDIFLRLSPIYWLVCLQRRENYSQLSYNIFHPYSVY